MQHKRNFQIAIWFFIMWNIAALQNKSLLTLQRSISLQTKCASPSGFPKRPAD
jgi:hypothetical protein